MKTFLWTLLPLSVIGVAALAQQPGMPGQTPPPGAAAAPGQMIDDAETGDFPPKRFDPRRYDAIFQRNPFMQEVVPVVEEAGPDDEWAKPLMLRAVSRIGGNFVVHVENTQLVKDEDPDKRRMAYHRLVQGQDDEKLRIREVKPHRDPSQVEVVVETGRGANVKTATLTYSDKQLKAKAPTVAKKPPTPGRPQTTRRTVTPRPTTPTTRRPSTTPGKRRVILPPGLPGSTQG